VLRLADEASAAVAALRDVPGAELASSQDALWLRGDFRRQERALAGLSVLGFFMEDEDGVLIEPGRSVPVDHLPEGLEWRPIESETRLRRSPGLLPAQLEDRVAIRLVRSGEPRPAGMLECRLQDLGDWIQTAPEVRFEGLEFALSENGTALVRGAAVPPVRGRHYTLSGRVAVPVGFRLEPAVPAGVLGELIGAGPGAWMVFALSGKVSVIDAGCFVPLSRAGLRIAMEGGDDAG